MMFNTEDQKTVLVIATILIGSIALAGALVTVALVAS